ncbi:NUDIX domain-containing protein [Microbacterium sp. C7(2022)]|uniref:NUDIX hydrolase n=1 Tax=Microbacterium sp. C7(2022) TaxID=2992759 RepID=UPI00237A6D58|nr:NUDIX domain-containing protein [Microbacterium sp. C7(2022)]MDE0547506.1 NUDIX domain-containing protein [Microbacterium sp. C7(2022)]
MTREPGVVRVTAMVVSDEHRRALVVRKVGASVFQQPGGKPDVGETALQTGLRELAEETGLVVDPADALALGTFTDAAANEPGHVVIAEAFAVRVSGVTAVASAEIAELRWILESEVDATPLAPLSRNHLIRHAWRDA